MMKKGEEMTMKDQPGKRYLDLNSARIIEHNGYIGLDDRYWLRVIEIKRMFRRPRYAIEILLARRQNAIESRDEAIRIAKQCIADMHDLIRRDEEGEEVTHG